MNIVVFGPPGGGKGTNSRKISEELDIPHIATGDIFRKEVNEGTYLGKKIEEYVEAGDLVPDDVVNKVVEKRLSGPDCEEGFVLDGYPRTKEQAEALADVAEIEVVVNLDVSDDVIINRLSSRRVCSDCGEIYNLEFKPPEEEGICDKCGGELYQREDDTPEVIKKRLEEYKERTRPLLGYYRDKGVVVDVTVQEERPIEEVQQEVLEKTKNALDIG
ncbi:adenylate kinase [candidate division MSBL1 archaeon SCGC-AAA382C18]|uniref:Adenylate kinase n=1 Tax=candidate division MSBL1 archaeon SCGC-AAA382C18 TaxID=1698281 RepID=A0A133VKH8_9EURY|nr:adenylate kinase [candidate division MSBL1 archaeon SCGC-AAA382C18]